MLSQKPVFVPSAGRRISEATKSRNAGTGVASILNPVNGYRDALARKGVKPKNHHKENLNAIRKKEELNMTAKADAAAEAQKSKFKMSRFANVPAKVTTNRAPTDAAAAAAAAAGAGGAPPNGTAYLKRGARAESSAASAATKQAAAAPGRTERRKSVSKPAVPTAAELKATAAPAPAPSAVDYVKENSRDVLKQSAALGAAKAQAAAAPSAAYKDKADFGRVPDYIIQRKLEEAAEADRRRMASKANEGVPPGMVKLSDEERAQTLALLNGKQNDLLLQLSQQPMFVETPSIVKRKFALEQSLKQVEDAIKVFSRKLVYVKAS